MWRKRTAAIGACWLMPLLATAADESGIVLADAPGRDRVQAACSMCHSLDYIVMNSPFLDAGAWQRTVNKMVKVMGAPLTDDQVAEITRYLAENYGKDSAASR